MIIDEKLSNACIDIDGVICRDPTVYENLYHDLYLNFLQNVPPNFQTDIELGYLVSARLEKYRNIVQNWLTKNNFKYKKLILLNCNTEQERNKLGEKFLIEFKSNILRESNFDYFYESNFSIAKPLKILNPTKQIFCTQTDSWL